MFLFDANMLWFSLLAAGLNQLINYCIGKPGGEFSPYEVFSGYTVWLSKRRLKKVGLYNEYSKQYHESLSRSTERHERISMRNDFHKMIYNAADPFFTWERMFGMCPTCTGIWVSVVTGFILTQNISEVIEIIVISHIVTRILNKIL